MAENGYANAVLVDHLESDEVRDVVRVAVERRQRRPRHRELRATLGPAIELDRAPAPSHPSRKDDGRGLTVDQQLGTHPEPTRILAGGFDDESSVDAVRAANPADLDELLIGTRSGSSHVAMRRRTP